MASAVCVTGQQYQSDYIAAILESRHLLADPTSLPPFQVLLPVVDARNAELEVQGKYKD